MYACIPTIAQLLCAGQENFSRAAGPCTLPGSAAPRLTLDPEPQLDHTLVACSREADLLLLGLSPALPLLSRRQLARAQRIAERARCPADLGPDRTVGDTVRT